MINYVIFFFVAIGISISNTVFKCSEKLATKLSKVKYYLLTLTIFIVCVVLATISRRNNLPELETFILAIGIGVIVTAFPYKPAPSS